MTRDIDIDPSLVGGVGNENLGQKASRVDPNKKCSGCLNYDLNRMLCLKGKQPSSCGAGASPETGYAPLIPDCVNHQEFRKKKGLKNQAPTPRAGKATRPQGPPVKVHVLGEEKVDAIGKALQGIPGLLDDRYVVNHDIGTACFIDEDGSHKTIAKGITDSAQLDSIVEGHKVAKAKLFAKAEYENLVIETAIEAADILKSFMPEAADPSAHDQHNMYSIRSTSHGSYHVTPHAKGGTTVHYIPNNPDGSPNHKASEPVSGSDQVGLPHEAVGAAIAAHHATTKFNNWVGNRNQMASQLSAMSGGQQAPSKLNKVGPAAPNTVKPVAKPPRVPLLPNVPKPTAVAKSIAFLQNLLKASSP